MAIQTFCSAAECAFTLLEEGQPDKNGNQINISYFSALFLY